MSIERWEIDSSNSSIGFAVRHLLISKARGRFTRWSGSVEVPDGDWSRAAANVVIDATSIDTGIARRDSHLRTPEYLDVARYPEITFRTPLVKHPGEGRSPVRGELSLKGRTAGVALHFQQRGAARDPWGNDRAAFGARAALDRRDFGIVGNFALDSGAVIGTRIEVEIYVEAVRQSAARVA